MRVIAGSARSIRLKTIEGMDTRPTTDRIKETLFNMLQNQVPGCSFLDLFAGSGAIGIEALSRGASKAVFVESNRQAAACIKNNLKLTKLEPKGQIYAEDVMMALTRLEGQAPFDIIFMDPPYAEDWERKVLEKISNASYADENTLIIVEAAKENEFSMEELEALRLKLCRVKQYKTNQHYFFRKA